MVERVDISASRNVDPWAETVDFIYSGDPLPKISSIDMEVRLYPGQPGSAKITPTVTFEDVADPTVADPDQRILRLFIEAPKLALTVAATGTGLNQPEAGEADKFYYDIIITYADAIEEKLAFGDFLLEPGVTA